MIAVAVRVSPENMSAIASEAGRKFTRQFAEKWLEQHKQGYFLRDETSTFDCQLMVDTIFFEMYTFRYPNDESSLFRPVVKIEES